ncbi:MAG: hypothetical protein IJ285_06625 [Clostridia bacterium]|nr:hypothetical protein [Oscillospiraceae bacterium]MBQ7960875.1 hypothetical protein [Clostridia bacterium]
MIKIHIGLKGTGKTKNLINDVNGALALEKGNVVCITEGNRLMHDIDRKVRMINTEQFDIKNFDMFTGLLCGIIAQDFDVTHIFIDSVFKSVPDESMANIDTLIEAIEKLEAQFNTSFTLMVSADAAEATELVKKYMA